MLASARVEIFGNKSSSCMATWSVSDKFCILGCAMEGMKDGCEADILLIVMGTCWVEFVDL